MKKQKIEKRLALKAQKISSLNESKSIKGGRTTLICPVGGTISGVTTCGTSDYPRCTHTIGNGQNPDGTPCKC